MTDLPQTEIDWSALAARFPGKPAFIRRIVQAAFDAHADDVGQLARIGAERDDAALAQLAHRIKGICGNLAAQPLAARTADLERAARAGDPAAYALVPVMSGRIATFLHDLRTFLAQSPMESEKRNEDPDRR
ncbi:MAG: Hpt domain-containing protein [Rhodocyclaceae bacterium]|nr:Hpt domain-containing protein [Rhodocyclaceae bacterium]